MHPAVAENQSFVALDGDPRISYRIENSEQLALESRSFDLVLCKESLHHLARPVLGLYEMLRVCRRAALWIESYATFAGRAFERLGWSSVYETQQVGNLAARDNYVYRFVIDSRSGGVPMMHSEANEDFRRMGVFVTVDIDE